MTFCDSIWFYFSPVVEQKLQILLGAWPPGAQDKKTPLSAEEQKDFAQLQNDIELYKAKLRNEFGYSNKDIKAQWAGTWDGWDSVDPLCTHLSGSIR